jgi:hypothetical protein
MARNNKKHYPVVRTGRLFRQSPDPIGPKIQISFDQLLSKTNRRLYRQSRYYDVKIDLDVNASRPIDVFMLCDSWMTERALKMGYDMYLENSGEERARIKGTSMARWEDFRVLSGANITIVNPLQYSQGFVLDELAEGEFTNTIVVDAAGTSKNFSWGPATASRYSLLAEYDKAGNASQSPDTSTGDMPYDNLQADDSATMAGLLQTSGSNPPYDANGVNATAGWVKVATLAADAAQKLSTGFFTAPCGIVLIQDAIDPSTTSVFEGDLQWTVKSGDYKGVHAPSMLE